MIDRAATLSRVCEAIDAGHSVEARAILRREYPFEPVTHTRKSPSLRKKVRIFIRDGFIDQYSGNRLVFPGSLRLLSLLLKDDFPYHPNWRSDSCHIAYWELYPTIDHRTPVSRRGGDEDENWLTTSMLTNAAKANFPVEELGWKIYGRGRLDEWDGLTSWFLTQVAERPDVLRAAHHLDDWFKAARAEYPLRSNNSA
jgi:hypothetical protein